VTWSLPFHPELLAAHALKMAASFVLALPVGWDRERAQRSAGLRTFPLVALASCGFVLVARETMSTSVDAQARIVQGIITGIGFIGGGAILRSGERVLGTATAASIWSTGAIGVSVALARFEIALLVCGVTFATLHFLSRVKPEVSSRAAADDRGPQRRPGNRRNPVRATTEKEQDT